MAIQPGTLWGCLSEELKQTIGSELTTILSEVIYDHYASCPTPSSQSKGRDIHWV
jgi:hypothetical protein